MFYQKQAGFTLIELLAVISIVGVIASFLMIGFVNFASFQQYNQAVSDIEFNIKQTRLSARSAELDSSHGIKFSTGSTTHFIGEAFSPVDPQNVITNYSLVTIETNLNSGSDEVIFNRLSGLPSATGTITISGVKFSASTTIEITDAGVIQ